MRRELIESYYEEYQRELERFLESDPEMFFQVFLPKHSP